MITDVDREKAADIITAGDKGPESWIQILAAALAAERDKAQAPFMELLREYIAVTRSIPDDFEGQVKWIYAGVVADMELVIGHFQDEKG